MVDTRDFVLKQIEERNVHFIRFWFTDLLGNLKSFAVTPSEVECAFEEGMGFDGSAIEGLSLVQESDMLVRPDASTFQILPWRPKDNGVARMFCDIYDPEGNPCSADSRFILMNMVRKAADMGFLMNIGTELEYFYFKDSTAPEPIDRGGYFDLTPLDNASDLRRDTVLTLEQVGIPVEYSHHGSAPSQHEIDLRFTDPLSAADSVMTARLVVKEIAMAQGVHASFMPKPLEDAAGSGMHVHQSLFTEDGENAFYDPADPEGFGLSDLAKHYIAGLLRYAPEFMLVTNQYVNSYKRLVPGQAAPMFVSWGNRNRSTMVRIPRYKPGKPQSTRLEVRSVDSAANPYLAFAVMLAAGLKGIEEELPLEPPATTDLSSVAATRRAQAAAPALPMTLGEAVEAFAASKLMRDVLGDHVHGFLVESKRAEWEAYRAHVSSWELDRYLHIL